jgi:pentose-5-phosphate-3-epimerase
MFLDKHNRPDAEIEVDGNVSIENAIKMREAGANIFVLGTAIQSVKEHFSSKDFEDFCGSVK